MSTPTRTPPAHAGVEGSPGRHSAARSPSSDCQQHHAGDAVPASARGRGGCCPAGRSRARRLSSTSARSGVTRLVLLERQQDARPADLVDSRGQHGEGRGARPGSLSSAASVGRRWRSRARSSTCPSPTAGRPAGTAEPRCEGGEGDGGDPTAFDQADGVVGEHVAAAGRVGTEQASPHQSQACAPAIHSVPGVRRVREGPRVGGSAGRRVSGVDEARRTLADAMNDVTGVSRRRGPTTGRSTSTTPRPRRCCRWRSRR